MINSDVYWVIRSEVHDVLYNAVDSNLGWLVRNAVDEETELSEVRLTIYRIATHIVDEAAHD